MFEQVVFYDEITLFWDKQAFDKATSFKAYLDGVLHGETDKTHYTYGGLVPATAYQLRIVAFNGKTCVGERVLCVQTGVKKKKIDVTASPYCAVGDGKTLNTTAIQRAMDDCDENSFVYIPAGVFMTGALTLHSDMELYVAEGATLQGTSSPDDYLPMKKSRFEGIEGVCYQSLLNFGVLDRNGGYTAKNVIIRGKGAILGGGRELLIATMEKAGAAFRPDIGPINDLEMTAWRSRGRLLEVCNAENVVLSGLTVGMSSSWNLHFVYSRNIITFGCKIVSKNVNNGDGWDPDSSENCTIFGCTFDTGDDCVAIKSGKNPEGNIINRPCKDIYIFDCVSRGGHGMSMGSEISGGIENVFIWDCDFDNTWFGIQVKATRKRGGYVKNLRVLDCRTTCIMIWSVGYNDDGIGAEIPPIFTDYYFENVVLTGTNYFKNPNIENYRRFVFLKGFEESAYHIQNATFKNISFVNLGDLEPLEKEYVGEMIWDNIRLIDEKGV